MGCYFVDLTYIGSWTIYRSYGLEFVHFVVGIFIIAGNEKGGAEYFLPIIGTNYIK